MNTQAIQELKLYKYTCSRCKSTKRVTIKKEKAEEGVCRKCRAIKIDPNQMPLL